MFTGLKTSFLSIVSCASIYDYQTLVFLFLESFIFLCLFLDKHYY